MDAELSNSDRDSMAHKAESIYSLAPCRKYLQTPASDYCDSVTHSLSMVALSCRNLKIGIICLKDNEI